MTNGTIVSCFGIIDKTWGNVKNISINEMIKHNDFREFCKKNGKNNDCNSYLAIDAFFIC